MERVKIARGTIDDGKKRGRPWILGLNYLFELRHPDTNFRRSCRGVSFLFPS